MKSIVALRTAAIGSGINETPKARRSQCGDKRMEETMQSRFRITDARRSSARPSAACSALPPSCVRRPGASHARPRHAPGNPRSVAADRMAAQLRERSSGRIEMRVAGSSQLGDDLAMLTGLHRHARHVGEQPGPGLDGGAEVGRPSATLSCSRPTRPPTASSMAPSGRRSRASWKAWD